MRESFLARSEVTSSGTRGRELLGDQVSVVFEVAIEDLDFVATRTARDNQIIGALLELGCNGHDRARRRQLLVKWDVFGQFA